MGEDRAAGRLDNFVDGAFAFALTLLVIAGGDQGFGYGQLVEAMWRVPAFAAGFALIANFWYAHVQWRRAGGASDSGSVLLSLALVFTVLVYVHPVRVMTGMLTDFVSGKGSGALDFGGVFTLYGVGFTVMAGLTAALYAHSERRGDLDARGGDGKIAWSVATASGILSVLLAQLPFPWVFAAPWTYSLLPAAVPLALRARRRRRHSSATA